MNNIKFVGNIVYQMFHYDTPLLKEFIKEIRDKIFMI